MASSVVQIGLGKVGAGFLCHLYQRSGLSIVGCDMPEALANFPDNRYELQLCGPDDFSSVPIQLSELHPATNKAAVAARIAQASFVGLAVPEAHLRDPCEAIARGLLVRAEAGGGPLNVLIALNRLGSGWRVRDAIRQYLPADRHALADKESLGCVQAVIARMCAGPFRAEDYGVLPIDAEAVVGTLPPIDGMEPKAEFRAWESLKMFVHNMAHMVAGALCLSEGIEHVDAITPNLATTARAAMGEAAAALHLAYPETFTEAFLREHVESLWRRIVNPALHDACARLVDDLVRKLDRTDRLIGAAELCLRHRIEPTHILAGLHAALRIDDPAIKGTAEIQVILREGGTDAVLSQVCDLTPHDPLWQTTLK